jgi:hypothetical protein
MVSAQGEIMDGLHRLAKAWILGNETIMIQRFKADPDPCWVDKWEQG